MADNDAKSTELGLYIHIPFCHSKCRYCDFNSFAGLSGMVPGYLEAVQREMSAWSELGARDGLPLAGRRADKLRVSTIYLGGGTPALLGGDAIATLLSACRTLFSVESGAEITVEANPDTIDESQLRTMLTAGANRLSIGVQSFNQNLLPLLGRRHTRRQIVGAYVAARAAGFDNITLDFIYGIPTETLDDWERDLEQAIELGPEHLSLYGLSVETGTPLWADIDGGQLATPDPDLAADMYIRAGEVLSQNGYDHYEISNWARPGRSCRHNLLYWRNRPYIGVGAGAHSSFCSVRLANVRDPADYIARFDPMPRRCDAQGSRSVTSVPPDEKGLFILRSSCHSEERSDEESAPRDPDSSLPAVTQSDRIKRLCPDESRIMTTSAAASIAVPAVERFPSRAYFAESGLAVVEEIVVLDRPTQMAETAMLNLRLAEGIDEQSFRRRFGVDARRVFGHEIRELSDFGLVADQGTAISLTPRGRLLGNEVFARILAAGRLV